MTDNVDTAFYLCGAYGIIGSIAILGVIKLYNPEYTCQQASETAH